MYNPFVFDTKEEKNLYSLSPNNNNNNMSSHTDSNAPTPRQGNPDNEITLGAEIPSTPPRRNSTPPCSNTPPDAPPPLIRRQTFCGVDAGCGQVNDSPGSTKKELNFNGKRPSEQDATEDGQGNAKKVATKSMGERLADVPEQVKTQSATSRQAIMVTKAYLSGLDGRPGDDKVDAISHFIAMMNKVFGRTVIPCISAPETFSATSDETIYYDHLVAKIKYNMDLNPNEKKRNSDWDMIVSAVYELGDTMEVALPPMTDAQITRHANDALSGATAFVGASRACGYPTFWSNLCRFVNESDAFDLIEPFDNAEDGIPILIKTTMKLQPYLQYLAWKQLHAFAETHAFGALADFPERNEA